MSNLIIDINSDCNEECRFCYQDLDGSVLPEEEIFKIIGEHSNVRDVEIGGGEPFLDLRIVNLIREIRKKGKNVHISTNGTLIPNGFLDLGDQVREGVQVQISLHASNPDLYQKIHGRNLFGRVMANIKRIKPSFETVISSAIYQDNFDDVSNLVALADNLDLPLRVNLVFPVGKGKEVKRLNSQQVDQLRGYLLKQRILKRDKIDSPLVHPNNCYALAEVYSIERKGKCPFDYGKIYVSSHGEKFGCEFYRKDINKNKKLLRVGDRK